MLNYNTNANNCGVISDDIHNQKDLPAWIIGRVLDFFALPSAHQPPIHIADRQKRRCDACISLVKHLLQPDGTLNLDGINLNKVAKALGIKYKHAKQALCDLIEIDVFAGQKPTLYGNGCGHDPEQPRYFKPPDNHAGRPKILQRIIGAIRTYYARPAETLPGLNACNESDRQQRSERREACIQILGAILHYTDLVTLRVGIPQADGSMVGLTMPALAKLSGLGERRAERAIVDLKAAGIITVHAICEMLEDLTYKGIAAIRTVTRNLFTVFGLDDWLAHERRRAHERQVKNNKKAEKARRKAAANAQMLLNAQLGPKPKAAPAAAETGKRYSSRVAQEFKNMRDILNGVVVVPDTS
jgi:hypothetical protein